MVSNVITVSAKAVTVEDWLGKTVEMKELER